MDRDRGYIKRNHYDDRDGDVQRSKEDNRRRRDSRGSPEDRFRRHRRSPSPERRSPRRRSPSPKYGSKRTDQRRQTRSPSANEGRRRSLTPDKNSRRARNNEMPDLRAESPTRLIMAIKMLKKSLVRVHGDAVVDRDDKKAKLCEWGVDRLDWGLADVRKHYERQESAVRAGNETKAELERHMMSEAKRKAIHDVHMKFEGRDIDLEDDTKPVKARPVSASTVGSHCEDCNECIDCKDPNHQKQAPPPNPPPGPYYQPPQQAQQYIYVDPRTGQQYFAGHNPNPYGAPVQPTPTPSLTPNPVTQPQHPADPSPLPGEPQATPVPIATPAPTRPPTNAPPPTTEPVIDDNIPEVPDEQPLGDPVQDPEPPIDYDALINDMEPQQPIDPKNKGGGCVIS